MNHRDSNENLRNYIHTTTLFPVVILTQSIIVEDPHIQAFFLGPSLYDYAHRAPGTSSSVASDSPPDSPPPETLPSQPQVSCNALDNTQHLINSPGRTVHKTGCHSNALQQTSCSQMSYNYETLTDRAMINDSRKALNMLAKKNIGMYTNALINQEDERSTANVQNEIDDSHGARTDSFCGFRAL